MECSRWWASQSSVLRKDDTRFEFRRDVLNRDLNLMLFGKRFV